MKSPVRDAGSVRERNGKAESPSVRLDIMATSLPVYEGRKRVPPFELQMDSIEARESRSRSDKIAAPEKKITLFALRLAILEKAASGLGTLAFFWASVVLLGGFAVTLKNVDFWFVTIILLTEGARIFSRSRELEWQHETTLISVATLRDDAKRLSRRFYIHGSDFILRRIWRRFIHKKTRSPKINIREENSSVENHDLLKRTWSTSKVELVPYTGWLFISRNASKMLFWLQLVSASTCVALCLYRLSTQDFGIDFGGETRNRKPALNIFYSLSLAEALLFLLEKAYWLWMIIARKLLTEVNAEYGFSHSELLTVRRFFYDTYSRCVNGSVFDGLKMEFVSYSMDLLQSCGGDRQVTGARVLSALANKDQFAEQTLRAIGTMRDVVERLIEILNWKNHHEQEIRRAAADIISKLVKKNQNRIRVTAIAGSMESIASLLYDSKEIEIHSKRYGDAYDYSVFSLLGLRILKSLANEHDNCAKIGSSRGLLPKIIGLTELNPNASESQIKMAKLALQLMGMLASSTGSTGKALRKGISEIVFTISNLRDVLHYREITTHGLQILAIDTLTSLALEEDGRESIGGTGGVLRSLFSVFYMERININIISGSGDDETRELVTKAGEALALLSLENKQNCRRMMSIKLRDHPNLIASLISVMDDPVQGFHAARILRNLCAYAEADYVELRKITATAAQVLKFVMEKRSEHQEAAIGLAAQIFKCISKSDFDRVFEESSGVRKSSLILELVKVLGRQPRPSNEVPSIRRFSIELLISVLEKDRVAVLSSLSMEMRIELKGTLEGVMETTSEMENYSTFSGSVGLSRHRLPISSLLHSAMGLLRDY